MKHFLEGFAVGGIAVLIVYHWGLQPILQKWRDDAIQKAKDKLAQTVSKPNP